MTWIVRVSAIINLDPPHVYVVIAAAVAGRGVAADVAGTV